MLKAEVSKLKLKRIGCLSKFLFHFYFGRMRTALWVALLAVDPFQLIYKQQSLVFGEIGSHTVQKLKHKNFC